MTSRNCQPVDVMAAWGDTLLAIGATKGELLFIDPATGNVGRRVSIPGAADHRYVCMAVMP